MSKEMSLKRTKSQNMLSMKEPTRIIMFNLWHFTCEQPQLRLQKVKVVFSGLERRLEKQTKTVNTTRGQTQLREICLACAVKSHQPPRRHYYTSIDW